MLDCRSHVDIISPNDAKAVKILLLFYVTVFLASVPVPRDTKPRANSFILCHYNDLAQIEGGF